MIALPGYQVAEQIHDGPRTVVYRGTATGAGTRVVLKTVKGATPSLQQFSRWNHEHTMLQQLQHPGVPRAFGLEIAQNRPVLVLEDIGAASLRNQLAGATMPLPTFFDLAIDVAEALGAIHARGIIHKDLNPSNVVLNPATGRSQIIDFGISSRLSWETPKSSGPQLLEGTLAYVSPEQTGRMNRSLDYRTDFYSLGATFYELLTGAAPFAVRDWMELVHCHLAKQPTPPRAARAEIPRPLSDLVMKLLAKTAEERYQSAASLGADLRRCRDAWRAGGSIAPFALGTDDLPDRLQLPQRLYGRGAEREALLAAYDQASGGATVLVTVAGYSGIGKSSLVHEIHRPIVQRRGFFAAGKFDQYRKNVPYHALLQAFTEVARQILTEDEAVIAGWRGKLLTALGPNGRVITDLIPEVGLIVGPQPELPAVSAAEAQNRFHLVVQNFVRVFARPEHPLVLFLDDLQWADLPTLRLLELLATDTEVSGLLIIGAYRDNQVNAVHPLVRTLQDIEKRGVKIFPLVLQPLTREHLAHLAADALAASPAEVGELAQVLLDKTHGNPFFVNQLLTALYDRGLIRLDAGKRRWQWDLDGIRAVAVTDNVADLMAAKLQMLAPRTRQVLQLAACIGSRFDLATLAIVHEQDLLTTGDDLWEALQEHLIVPIGNGYQLLEGVRLRERAAVASDEAAAPEVAYRFVHDQIQQAAYALIEEGRNKKVHLTIGRLLRAKLPPAEQEERLFDIVNHLNLGAELVDDPAEREALLRLNLAAGKKARGAAAFSVALGYLQSALALLPKDPWRASYDLALELHLEAAEAAYLATDFAEMARIVADVQHNARGLLDKVRAYEVEIEAQVAQNKLIDSVETGLSVLRMLGVRFPRKPKLPHVMAELVRSKIALAGKDMETLRRLPAMTDPTQLAAMRVLSRVIAPAYMAAPALLPLMVFRKVILSARHGNGPTSAYAYATYGMILGAVLGDAKAGNRFGTLALDLLADTRDERQKPRVYQVAHSFTRHWTGHARATLAPLLEAFQAGADTGDFEYAAYACLIYSFNSLTVGRELGALEQELATFIQAMAQFKHETNHRYLRLWRQSVLNLLGRSADPTVLVGEAYDENAMLPQHRQAGDRTGLFYAYFNRMMLQFLFGQHDAAAESARLANQYQDGVTGVLLIPRMHFYDALIQLTRARPGHPPSVARQLRKLRKWARNAPMNFQHQIVLIEAESARVRGHEAEAIRLYDEAVTLARGNEYLQDEALANELAAEFYLARNLEHVASAYMATAHLCYARWGATAKVQALEKRFPALLDRQGGERTVTLSTGSLAKETLDFASILKASQAISSEIIYEELLRSLIKIAIENAGATRGALLLQEESGPVVVATSAINETEAALPEPAPLEAIGPDGRTRVPASIVNYVAHTQKPIVFDDAAAAGMFVKDPYVLAGRTKSVVCLPLLHHRRLVGLLYLENDLTAGAFTPQRLEVLQMLSAQMAISITNARLYRNLEQVGQRLEAQVKERTREAEQAKQAAEHANAAKSQFLANMSHEIRTPLTALLGFADLLYEPRLGDGDRFKYARTIRRNGEHLLSVINNILDLSKIEADKMAVEAIACPLGDILNDVAGLMSVRAAEKALAFEVKLAGPVPALIKSDPTRLRQILLNLVGNAIKFTPRGSVRVLARTEGTDGSARLVVDVIDTGIGLDGEQIGRLFQPFQQADLSMTRRYGGSGLGLAICRRLAQALGGDITVQSQPGQGSTFTLALAVEVPAGTGRIDTLSGELPAKGRMPTPAPMDAATAARRGAVLLAEDGEDNQVLLGTLLRKWGFTATVVADGQAAVESGLRAWREGKPYDVILMDMEMPVLDGYGATTRLRAEGYRGPILALTAHAMAGERERCLAAGCDDFLTKPIERHAFRAALERHLTPPAG